MRIATGLLAMLTSALGADLLTLVVQPYYAPQIASDHLGYRSNVHIKTMQFLNGHRLAQAGATLASHTTDEFARNFGEMIEIRPQQGHTIFVGMPPMDPTRPICSLVTNPAVRSAQ